MAKVLLVEDDNNLREIYEARLQAEGYETVTASDGEQALVVAKDAKPDLVISDVMMPKISGFEMLDILRNTDGLKDVKVIMLTALGQSEDKTRADQLGADKYLVKSQVTLEDIVKTAHELLDEGAAPAVAPSTAPEVAPAVAPESLSAPEVVAEAAASVAPVADSTEDETKAMQAQIDSFAATPAEPAAVAAPLLDTPVDPVAGAVADDAAVTPVEPPTSAPEVVPEAITPIEPAPASTPEVVAEPEVVTSAETVSPAPEVVATEQTAEAHDDEVMANAVDSLATSPEAQKPSDVTAVEVAPPAPLVTPAPAAPVVEATTEDAESDGVTSGHKKIISPISDVAAKPDITELLAAEEAATTADQPAAVAPAATTVAPNVTEPPVDPTKPNPNDIAL